MFEKIISFIRYLYGNPDGMIPLHAPCFTGTEKEYLLDCIDSTFVSCVGKYVDEFEQKVASFTGAKYAVATVNGTAALQVALLLAGVKPDDEVLTQAVSFVATANAINYCGAQPVFLDSDKKNLGLNPIALEEFLSANTEQRDDGFSYNKMSGQKISACVPVHVFGHSADLDPIVALLKKYNIPLIEDAAESLGSFYKEKHTGTFGLLGILSFNGNKIITTGGGGVILTNNPDLAQSAKHITTTAKVPHSWNSFHNRIGFNYRMPNVNAALGCAQMAHLPVFLEKKRTLSSYYRKFFEEIDVPFFTEPRAATSNYWLNAITLLDREQRDRFLRCSREKGVMTRPLWNLLSELPMYSGCQNDGLENAKWLWGKVVNIPSSIALCR